MTTYLERSAGLIEIFLCTYFKEKLFSQLTIAVDIHSLENQVPVWEFWAHYWPVFIWTRTWTRAWQNIFLVFSAGFLLRLLRPCINICYTGKCCNINKYFALWILASDWSRQVTWPGYWPLIGPDRSRDKNKYFTRRQLSEVSGLVSLVRSP